MADAAVSMGSDGDAVANGARLSKNKLHGRAFYESIGSPKFVVAPMVDQSEFAWRMLTRSFMPASGSKDDGLLAYTPMLHSRLFTETPKFRDAHFQPLRSSLISSEAPPNPPSDVFLDGNPQIDRPLFVQFCANKPEELLEAAKYVAPFCDAVDLNLGCPQGIARKGHYGAFLQEDQNLIYSLINKLHTELDVPVTAKIRILETREKTLEYAKMVLSAGASILTVHGRTRDMKGHKTGLADWAVLRYLREELGDEVVLFANGNILRKEDVTRCLAETGADAVMSAEGNLYDPAIFADAPPLGQEGREYWRGKDGKGGWRMDAVFRRYMDILYRYVLEVTPPVRKPLYLPSDPADLEPESESKSAPVPEKSISNPEIRTESTPPTITNGKRKSDNQPEQTPQPKKQRRSKAEKTSSPNLLAMQPHLFHLLRPLVARHHPVRDALARSRSGDIAAFENVLQMTEAVVKQGLQEYAASNGRSWETEVEEEEKKQKERDEERVRNLRVNEASQINGSLDGAKKGEEAEAEMDQSSVETVKACKRPWWVVQPYVRPLPKEALAKGSLTLSKKDRMRLEAEAVLKKKTAEGTTGGHVVVEGLDVEKSEEVEIQKEAMVCG